MRTFLSILTLLVSCYLHAQINVFECNSYINHMTQAEINAAADHFGTCIEMGGTQSMNVSGTANKTVYASKQIQLKENTYAGNFNSSGGFRLLVIESGLEVAAMHYEQLNQILRYKKFELGIKVPAATLTRINHFLQDEGVYQDELNPFLEWDVDVEMIFYHAASGIYKTIDGYYHREYFENPVTDDWDDIGTDYPFRVRFAPPQNGKWIAKAVIKINEQVLHTSEWFGFHVIESGDPGYVKVHPNRKNLMRGNNMIFPVGHNFPSPDDHSIQWGGNDPGYLGNNLYSSSNTSKAANTREWESYRAKIESYFQQGGKYIRTIQTPWSSLIEFEKKGNYYDRLHYAWEQDKLLDLCEQYDALMMFNMMMHTSYEVVSNYYLYLWDWENWLQHVPPDNSFYYDTSGDGIVYCYNDNPQQLGGRQPHEALADPDDLKYHQQRTRYYIARYGYSTKIYEFELLSEPFNVGINVKEGKNPYFEPDSQAEQQILFDAIYTYHGSLGWFIKEKMKHTDHLIGVDYSMGVWDTDPLAIKMDQSFNHGNIDIIGLNYYGREFNKYIISKDGSNNAYNNQENTRARAVKEFQAWGNKPVILSEFGDGDGTHLCSNYSGVYVDLMSAGFTGVSGYNLWEGKDAIQSFVWPFTIRAQGHMNGADVIPTLSNGLGNWIQGRQHARLTSNLSHEFAVEHQYYISNNKERSVGYVRNRTYNVYTKIDPASSNMSDCILQMDNPIPVVTLTNISWTDPPSTKRLRIEGLKNFTDYQIDWYSYKNGDYLGSQCRNSSLQGGFDLMHPVLFVTTTNHSAELPVLWYVVRQMNCSNSMLPIGQETEAFLLEENEELMNSVYAEDAENGVRNGSIDLSIYPNPFGNQFVVNSQIEDVLILQAVDGTIIGRYAINPGESVILVPSISKGVYIALFQNQKKHYKIIKQ